MKQFSSVQSLSRVWLFATPWTTVRQASLSITNSQSLPKSMSIESVMPSNHLILCHPLLLLPSIFPRRNPSPIFLLFTYSFFSESVLCIRWPNFGASASASVLPMNIQDWFPLGWLVWSPCSPRDSQESSPTPQFKSISSSALNLLYDPTLPFVHDYWKSHGFDYTDLCWQSDISAFYYAV